MSTPGAPYLSLVLACYNEAEHLEASFAEIKETLEQTTWPCEVIFVDDKSRDRTPEILRSLVAGHPELDLRLILHGRNRGRGATVSDGFRAARVRVADVEDHDGLGDPLHVHVDGIMDPLDQGREIRRS